MYAIKLWCMEFLKARSCFRGRQFRAPGEGSAEFLFPTQSFSAAISHYCPNQLQLLLESRCACKDKYMFGTP